MLRLGLQLCAKKLLPAATSTGKIGLENTVLKNAVAQKTECSNTLTEFVRDTSFFAKIRGDLLWKGVISVSNAGKRRGRGKGTDRRFAKNLNQGQVIGFGKKKILWPGLNSPVVSGRTVQKIQPSSDLPDKLPRHDKFLRHKNKIHPLERGWSGHKPTGRYVQGEEYDYVILELKVLTVMDSKLGKKKKFISYVAVGNKNGTIGLGKSSANESKSAITHAKNKALKRIIPIELIEKHTVNHDFYSQFGSTKLIVKKKPKGYGLRCHRVLISCCKLLGIQDLSAKVEGAVNVKHIIKAFIMGLLKQKTYQDIADETKLHLVEYKEERYNYPKVLASPKESLLSKKSLKEPVSFEKYVMGNLIEPKKEIVPFYQNLPSWTTYLKRTLYKRNHKQVEINLIEEYGDVKSFLTERYPESVGHILAANMGQKQKE